MKVAVLQKTGRFIVIQAINKGGITTMKIIGSITAWIINMSKVG